MDRQQDRQQWLQSTLVTMLQRGHSLEQFYTYISQYQFTQAEINVFSQWLQGYIDQAKKRQLAAASPRPALAGSQSQPITIPQAQTTQFEIENTPVQDIPIPQPVAKNPVSSRPKETQPEPIQPQPQPQWEQKPAGEIVLSQIPADRNLTDVEVERKAAEIIFLCHKFKADCDYVGWQDCPRFYEIRLRPNLEKRVRVESVLKLQQEMVTHLWLPKNTIMDNSPGYVSVQIPKMQWDVCGLLDYVRPVVGRSNPCSRLSAALGVNKNKELIRAPIDGVLIGGARDSGKTTLEMAIVCGLMAEWHPAHLQFVFFDLKEAGFSQFNGCPWMWRKNNVITDPGEVLPMLEDLERERATRQRLFSSQGVTNIWDYNRKVRSPLPQILIVTDELDMVRKLGAPPKDEGGIGKIDTMYANRLQWARTAGFAELIGAQRPSNKVLHELVDANLLLRIGLLVADERDSAIILGGRKEAAMLEGFGDMWVRYGAKPLQRLQGLLVTEADIERIISWGQDNYSVF